MTNEHPKQIDEIELPRREGDNTAVVVHGDTTQGDTVSFIQLIERAARDPSVNLNKLERLLAIRNQIIQSEYKRAFVAAMSSAQTSMQTIATDSSNPQTHSKYASYPALDRAIRPIYTANGFSLTFDTADCPIDSHVRIVCDVDHTGGHSRQYHIDMAADGQGAKGGSVMTKTHATGAAITYGRRYLLLMIFNLAVGVTDDDGNAADRATSAIVSDVELAELNRLITATKSDERKFLNFFKIAALSELPKKRLAEATALLNQKKKGK
jgi:hypothetical protein